MKDLIKHYASIYEDMCKEFDCEDEQMSEAYDEQTKMNTIDEVIDLLSWIKAGKTLSSEDLSELSRAINSLKVMLKLR